MLIAIRIIDIFFQVYTLMLFARIISSWLPQLNQYKAMQFITYYTDPYLNFFRRFIPPLGMMDFSPIVAFLCLSFIQNIVINLLVSFAR
jgi:YggT family protein